VWPGGVRALDSQLKRLRIKVLLHFQVTTLGKLSVNKQHNLLLVKQGRCLAAGKVTIGVALYYPCITDFSGLSTYELKAQRREMSTLLTLIMGYGTLHHISIHLNTRVQ